jgi:hypothetical protein
MATTRNLEAMSYKFGRLTKQAYETSSCECSSGCVSELCFCRRGPQTCRVDKCVPQAEQQVPTFDPLSWPSSCSGTIPLAYPLKCPSTCFCYVFRQFQKTDLRVLLSDCVKYSCKAVWHRALPDEP